MIRALIYTVRRFFGGFSCLLGSVTDFRNPRKITYPLAGLLFSSVMMYLCRLRARRQIGLLLRNASCRQNFHALFGVTTCPRGDTLDDAFSKLDPQEVQEVVSKAVDTLIRRKVLYICETYGWKFMTVLKDSYLSSINEELVGLSPLQSENRLLRRVGREGEVKQSFQ